MTPARALAAGLALTMAAGFTDAVGFVELGGYFTSFMSGNSTQLAFGAAMGNLHAVLLPASLVACFFAGGFAGTMVALRTGARSTLATLALCSELLFSTLLLHALGVAAPQSLLLLAASAGAQNTVLRSSGSARLGATYVTGTLFMASQELALALHGKAPGWRWAQHMLVWLALLLGALAGAVGHGRFGIAALAVPLALYALLAVGLTVSRRQADRG